MLAENGGVFCVYNQSGWLTKDPTISINHFIDHVEHVINLGGEDSVAVGTDQDVVDMTAMRPTEVEDHNRSLARRRQQYPELTWEIKHMRVPELSHPQRLLRLVQALQQRGYSTGQIEKIIGGNYARLFREVVG
jgi:membrane dipeptidase